MTQLAPFAMPSVHLLMFFHGGFCSRIASHIPVEGMRVRVLGKAIASFHMIFFRKLVELPVNIADV
jgi:hypothetical protein